MKLKIVLFILIATPAHARIGCLDKSAHLEQRFDYKKYHFVQCNCPCEQAYSLTKNGSCTECGHRRDEVLITLVTTDPSKLVDIQKLKQHAQRGAPRHK